MQSKHPTVLTEFIRLSFDDGIEIKRTIAAGRAGVFMFFASERGIRGRLLHNDRQVFAFCDRWSHYAPSLVAAVRAAWSAAQELRAAHVEPHPVRVSPRPEAA